MNKEYYDILGLNRDATIAQIVENYKNLVLRWHPKFAKEEYTTSYHHFSEISQAYEVLSDPVKRAFYDKYGWQKLKEGHFAEGQLKGGYRFGGNPDEIFEKFFFEHNSLANTFDKSILERGTMFGSAFGALGFKTGGNVDKLMVKVPCTLQQLYRGMTKKVSYERKILNLDGRTLSLKKEQKLLEIKPGHGQGTTLTFPNQGNQSINRLTSDLIFEIIEIPHPLYSRINEDLIYTATVSLADSLGCKPLEIKTLDNRKIKVSLDQVPNPQVLKQVANEGMPIVGEKRKGTLYIKFDIEFPKSLNQSVKNELRKYIN